MGIAIHNLEIIHVPFSKNNEIDLIKTRIGNWGLVMHMSFRFNEAELHMKFEVIIDEDRLIRHCCDFEIVWSRFY